MSFYSRKLGNKRGGDMCVDLNGNISVSPRAAALAFFDGVATLVDIFPDPRPRTIRAFACHHTKWAASVNDAIYGDWAMVGQDMWAAIRAHDDEANEKTAAGSESLNAR
jgi:hypothetical protein